MESAIMTLNNINSSTVEEILFPYAGLQLQTHLV